MVDLEPVLVEIIQEGKVIVYLLIGDEIVVRGHSSRQLILNRIEKLLLKRFRPSLFHLFLSSQPRTCYVFTLPFFDDLLVELLLEQLLEMPETAIHVEMVGRVLLRFVAADVGGPVELGTAAGLECWFDRTLRPGHLIAPLLLRKHITIHC